MPGRKVATTSADGSSCASTGPKSVVPTFGYWTCTTLPPAPTNAAEKASTNSCPAPKSAAKMLTFLKFCLYSQPPAAAKSPLLMVQRDTYGLLYLGSSSTSWAAQLLVIAIGTCACLTYVATA